MQLKPLKIQKEYYKNSQGKQMASYDVETFNPLGVLLLSIFNGVIFLAIAPFICLMLICGSVIAKFDPRITLTYDFHLFNKHYKGKVKTFHIVKYYSHKLKDIPKSETVDLTASWGER